MSRIARNSVNGRLNRNTFYSGAEVVMVQCKRGLSHSKQSQTLKRIHGLYTQRHLPKHTYFSFYGTVDSYVVYCCCIFSLFYIACRVNLPLIFCVKIACL